MLQKHPNRALLNIEKILQILPHRYPFLMVDRVLEIKKGESIIAIKNVTCNEPFFSGHFPEKKVMPGVLVMEAIAQAGGVLLFHSIPDPQNKLLFLTKIDNTKFRKPVVPGDQLRIEASIVRMKHKFCHLRGKALVDGEVVAEADAMAYLVSLEELDEQE